MTNATDALPDKIVVESLNGQNETIVDGETMQFELPEHAADAWAAVLIDVYDKRKQDSPNETPAIGNGDVTSR
ncbi:hypothetical protein [Rosistilla oblonga]|uniref:Uncharacterized protein n=1 Tax=Rosistilla oblonga TaxID=2527990 RepID=A0A518J055_9BACT|nr:hypothetical protein [Rosistilla oblonga]QDV58712.1 hypothetical protein Mal33_47360 [Rosistilla oblonga]